MVREIIKTSCLLFLLTQFHTISYSFLYASTTPSSSVKDSIRVSQMFMFNQKSITSTTSITAARGSWNSSEKGNYKKSQGINEQEEETQSSSNMIMDISMKMDPLQIMIFEQKLLKLLGMKKRPRRDKGVGGVHVPKYLTQLHKNQLHMDLPTSNLNLPGRFTRSANTIRSFYHHHGKERKLKGLNVHLKFDLSSIPSTEKLTGAELRVPITLESKKAMRGVLFQILVHDVVKFSPNVITYPIDSKSLKSKQFDKLSSNSSNLWLTFDVFPAISRWSSFTQKSKSYLNLAIEIIDMGIRSSAEMSIMSSSTTPTTNNIRVRRSKAHSSQPAGAIKEDNEHTPMLLTYSDDGRNSRSRDAKTLSRNYRSFQHQRRRRNHRHKNRRRNLCSRKKMFVDFTDVGWNDWIVAPPGYQAFFCSGECPYPMAEHLNATNHAVIQALVNSMNPRLVPPPCCIPATYSSLSLLYTDSSDRIVLKNYNEMIVDSCGCS